MRRRVLFLLSALLTASVSQAAAIYTLSFSFPVAGDHTVLWVLPDFLSSGTGAGPEITTSEGQPVESVAISQYSTELWIFFNFVTPADHRIQSTGPSVVTPGFVFPISPGETGTFSSTVGGSVHCGPPAPSGSCPVGSDATSSARLSVQLAQPVPEPSSRLTVFLGVLAAVGVRTLRQRRAVKVHA